MSYQLLSPGDPAPVFQIEPQRPSAFVIAVDHAGRHIPRRLGNLGLPAGELERHIAWDIGAREVGMRVAVALEASFIAQNYSRLVIDCNRDPRVASSIPTISESTEIPGNQGLDAEQIAARRAEVFQPYHDRLRQLLDARQRARQPTIFVAQHTMTDNYKGVRRMMHAAVLYNRDRRFAGHVLDILRREPGLVVADNEPYFVSDETDYSIPTHGEARGLLHVEIEIRQDLVRDEAGQATWAAHISEALRGAERAVRGLVPTS